MGSKGSPNKRFASEKDKLISEAGAELQSRADEIARLSELNARLREKLIEFQSQNEANARTFQEETSSQSLKNRQLLEANRLLREEQARNADKINDLLLKNHSLAKGGQQQGDLEMKVCALLPFYRIEIF